MGCEKVVLSSLMYIDLDYDFKDQDLNIIKLNSYSDVYFEYIVKKYLDIDLSAVYTTMESEEHEGSILTEEEIDLISGKIIDIRQSLVQ